MRQVLETLGGVWELIRLAFVSRFRFSGNYWTWRLHTAFGRGYPARITMARAVFDYAKWMFRMRRGR